MTDRPILFSAPMVRALLSGQKTQTRRLVKPPHGAADRYPLCHPQHNTDVASVWWHDGDPDGGAALQLCPYGAPGDRLWVRETWAAGACADGLPPGNLYPGFWKRDNGGLWYAADGKEPAHAVTPKGKTRNPIHMPRWASRLTLKITEVRVERLQDISEADAIAEGVREASLPAIHMVSPEACGEIDRSKAPPRLLWEMLWRSINGPDSWDANPWVWALTFEVEQ